MIGDALAFNTVKVRDNTGKERILITGVCLYNEEIPKDIKAINDQNLSRFMIDYGIIQCENTDIGQILAKIHVDKQ